ALGGDPGGDGRRRPARGPAGAARLQAPAHPDDGQPHPLGRLSRAAPRARRLPRGEVRAALLGLGAALMLVGLVQDYRAVRPLQQQSTTYLAPMIASIGASTILVNLAQGLFGAQASRFPPDLFPTTPYPLGEAAVIAPIQL